MRSRDRMTQPRETSRNCPFENKDASGPTIAPVVPDPAPVASNLVVNEEPSTPMLGASDATLTLPLGEDGAGSNPVDLPELSDSSAEEDSGEKSGGEKSNEQVPDSNPQGTVGNFGESSVKEQGNVDEVENPSDLMIDETGSASDQLGAQVVGEDFDCAEDRLHVLLLFLLSFLFLALRGFCCCSFELLYFVTLFLVLNL